MSDRTVLDKQKVSFRDLRGYLEKLDSLGLLKHIKAEVDLKHELGAICVRGLKLRGPGLMFENIKGYPGMRFVSNILSTTEQLAAAFGTELDEQTIYKIIQAGKANPVPPQVVEGGPCQEEVHLEEDVDIYEFPTPWWHELDGGQYIGTTAGVITQDPETGHINMGMYRVMIKDKNTLALNIRGPHEVGEDPTKRGYGSHTQILKHEAAGRPAPVALAIGMDPLLEYVAAQGVNSAGVRHAEYGVAGAWRGIPTELIKCKTNDLLVPAWSEIVLEGETVLNERTQEGPHGESQGFYGWNNKAFIMKVRGITHRKNPINYGLICRPHEDYPKFMLSAGLRARLNEPLIKDVYVPEVGGGGMGLMAIVSATVSSKEDVQRVIKAVHEVPHESYISRKPRWLIIVDDDCDLRDWEDVMWRVSLGVMPDQDVSVGERSDPIAHEPLADIFGNVASSVVVDATFNSKKGLVKGKEGFPPVNKVSRELMAKVQSRWKEYGLG